MIIASLSATAHTPEGLELEYNYESQSLTVMITHNTAAPNTHYVVTVEIYRNDVLYISQNYTSQPSLTSFSYYYDVTADDKDVIKVTAICSVSGDITNQLTVKMPTAEPGEMDLFLTNGITSIDEGLGTAFDISITEGGCDFCPPVQGAALTITAEHGTVSAADEFSAGNYRFTYDAPDVTANTTETINITATKNNYNTSYLEFQFSILVLEEPPDGDEPMTDIDGKIGDDEYDFDAEFSGGDFKIYWKIEGDIIQLGMKAKTSGWIALGIEPRIRMKDADMYIGWVTGGSQATLVDGYSIGEVGPHPADTEEGGTDDIIKSAGTEANGWTIIEFTRKLETGDTYDKDLDTNSDIDIIWAYGNSDNFDARHSVRGAAVINLGTGEVEEKATQIWIFHAVWMSASVGMMLVGLVIAKTQKSKKWWMKAHRALGTLGALFAVLGILSGIYMVGVSTNQHFRVLHTWVGGITIVFVVAAPFLCRYMFKIISKVKQLKSAHRWVGRISVTLMVITILMGLSQAGVI